jgi:flagellar L-ring protein precursor FlgH
MKTKTLLALGFILVLSSCSSSQIERLEWIGKAPPMEPMQPKKQEDIVNWPAQSEAPVLPTTSSSLWASNSKTFFKDQRANKVGDILKVKVSINDKATFDNKTERKREESDNTSAPSVFGLEKKIAGLLPGKGDPASLLDMSNKVNNKGEGNIERQETINTEIAAVVSQVLPNGNFVIYGSQEVRVNFEVRQLTIQGVIRPEDISTNNEIKSSQVAEARISYGGKGVITDIQQPRIGNQVADILSPF